MGLDSVLVDQAIAPHVPPRQVNQLLGSGVRAVFTKADYGGDFAAYERDIHACLSQPFMLPPAIHEMDGWVFGDEAFWKATRLPMDNSSMGNVDGTDGLRVIVSMSASFADVAQRSIDYVAKVFTRSPFISTVGVYFDDTERNWARAIINVIRLVKEHEPPEDRARYREELFSNINLDTDDVSSAMRVIEATLPALTPAQEDFIRRVSYGVEDLGTLIGSLDDLTDYVKCGVKDWFTDTRTRAALIHLFVRILMEPDCAHAMFAGYSWYPRRPWPAIFVCAYRGFGDDRTQYVGVSAYPRATTPDAAAYPSEARPVYQTFETSSMFRTKNQPADTPPMFRYMCESDFNICTVPLFAWLVYGISSVIWTQDSDTITVVLNLLEQLQIFPLTDILLNKSARPEGNVRGRAVGDWPYLRSNVDRTRLGSLVWVRNTKTRCTVVDMIEGYQQLYVNLRQHYREYRARDGIPENTTDTPNIAWTLQMPALLLAFAMCEGGDYVPHKSASLKSDVIDRCMAIIRAGGVGYMRDPAGSGFYHPYCHTSLFKKGVDAQCLTNILHGQYLFGVVYYLSACNHIVPASRMLVNWKLSNGNVLEDAYQFQHYTRSSLVTVARKITIEDCALGDPRRASMQESIIMDSRLQFAVFTGRRHYEAVLSASHNAQEGEHPLDGVDYGIVDYKSRPLIVHPESLPAHYYGTEEEEPAVEEQQEEPPQSPILYAPPPPPKEESPRKRPREPDAEPPASYQKRGTLSATALVESLIGKW